MTITTTRLLKPEDLTKAQQLLAQLSSINKRLNRVDIALSKSLVEVTLRTPVGRHPDDRPKHTDDPYTTELFVRLPPNDPDRLELARILQKLILSEREPIFEKLQALNIIVEPDYIG